MYLMFLGPYQEGGDFRDEGISGIRRFLDKVWTAVLAVEPGDVEPPRAVLRKLHQTIRKVTADTEDLRYNTALAAMMEYVNLLRDSLGLAARGADMRVPRELVEPLMVMLAPYAPHFAEECWERLVVPAVLSTIGGRRTTVFDARWPSWDEELAAEDEVELVVQVNGKVRARLRMPRGTSEKDALARALADEGIKKYVDGQKVKKVVFVEDRVLNLVV
jgi:leucyl-tRNA synthetase